MKNHFEKALIVMAGITTLALVSLWIFCAFFMPVDSVVNQLNPLVYFKVWLLDDVSHIDSFVQTGIYIILFCIGVLPIINILIRVYKREKYGVDKDGK